VTCENDKGTLAVHTDALGRAQLKTADLKVCRLLVRLEKFADATTLVVLPSRAPVTISLIRGLSTIARVKATLGDGAPTVTRDSASALVNDTLLDQIGTVPGVTIEKDGNGISLRGMDPRLTGFKIDGLSVPGGVPSSVASLGLFSAANVDFTPTAQSSAGSLNYFTLSPTTTWKEALGAVYGSFSQSSYQASVSGSKANLGIAFLHAWRGTDSPRSGLLYEDQTGIDHPHGGQSRSSGDVVKLTYQLKPKFVLQAEGIGTRNIASDDCSYFVTIKPCGNDAGVGSREDYYFGALRLNGSVGKFKVELATGKSDDVTVHDAMQAVLARKPAPYFSRQRTLYNVSSLDVRSALGRQSPELFATSYSGSTGSQEASVGFSQSSNTVKSGAEVDLSDSVKLSRRVSIHVGISAARASDVGGSFLSDAGVSWMPDDMTQIDAVESSGSSTPDLTTSTSYSDPLTADFNCGQSYAFVRGPSLANGPQHGTSLSINAKRKWTRGNLEIGGYSKLLINVPFQGALPIAGAALDAPLPSGYTSLTQQTYQDSTICGPGDVLPPSRFFAYEPLSGVTQRLQGISATGRTSLGQSTVALLAYGISSASVQHVDDSLQQRGFVLPIGRQLPGRPLQTGSITFAFSQPKSNLLFVLTDRFVGSSNVENVAPYQLFNIGVLGKIGGGNLSLLISNIFDTETGLFSTNRGLNPLPIANGGFISLPSDPLPFRRFIVTYKVMSSAH